MIRVLFVCTGNTCRSPIAEAMLRHLAEKEDLPIEVKSAGVSTSQGIPTSAKSKQALFAKGISFSGQSQQASEQLLDWADYILTMTESHKQTLLLNYPHMMDKVFTLKQFAWMTDEHQVLLNELDSLIAELQMQFQLNQTFDEALRQKAFALESQLPDFDIADPFGGSQADYDRAAQEIEEAVHSAFQKFKIIMTNPD